MTVSNTCLSWLQERHFGRRSKSRWNWETRCLLRDKIKIAVKIQIILAQNEWSSTREAKTIHKRYNKRQRQTFCNVEKVSVFNIATICVDGEELLRQAFHQKYRRSHNETDVRHIWQIGTRPIRWDLWTENNKFGKLFREIFVFDWWCTSHPSSTSKKTKYSQILCCVLEKWTRPLNQIWHGKTDWRGWIQHVATQSQSKLSHKVQELLSRLSVTPEKFYRTDSLHVDVQRHLMGIEGQWERLQVKCSTRFSLCEEIRSRTMGHSSNLDRRKSGIPSVRTVHNENGTKWQRRWCWYSQKADTQSSVPRVHCPEECLKSKGDGRLSIHYCADQDTITTFFRTITSVNQFSFYGAVVEMCEE